MSKDAPNSAVLTDEAKKKLAEFVSLAMAGSFGPEGPAKDTTFTEIEDFGHEVGRTVARAVEEALTHQHSTHFQEESPCPTCGTSCPVKEEPLNRDFKTNDGVIPLEEPAFHCPACSRDFFPSTHPTED